MSTSIARVNMSYDQVRKCECLLDMLTTAAELAQEPGCSPETVRRSYLVAGAPVDVDDEGHTWIVGSAFRAWAVALYAGRRVKRRRMAEVVAHESDDFFRPPDASRRATQA